MKYFIHFDTDMSQNYKYWFPLFNQFINNANYIRIDCWNNQVSVIENIKQLSDIISIDTESNLNITTFMVKKTKISVNHLLAEPFTDNNLLKYFHLSLWQDNLELISSEHYGKECTICNINHHEVELYMKYIPKSSSIIVHNEEGVVYKENN